MPGMLTYFRLPVLVLLLCVASHAGAQIFVPDGVDLLENIAYGEHRRQRLDVYRPSNTTAAPIIVMVHGGAWRFGDKANDAVVENKLLRWGPRGIVFVSLNYRLLPDAAPVAQADDIAAALVYVQQHASQWGGDPKKLVLMGHSAGAHLITLVAAAPQRILARGGQPWLATVSLDTAAFDMLALMERRHMPVYDRVFGDEPTYWRQASPLHQLEKGAQLSPILAVCSSTRPDKPCADAARFAEQVKVLGGRMEVMPVAMSHAAINADLGDDSDYTKSVEKFLRSLDDSLSKRLQ